MLESIGIFVAQQLAGYGLTKGEDKIFSKDEKFVQRLAKIIESCRQEFDKEFPLAPSDKLYFHNSRIIMEELLKWSFFKNENENFDHNRIQDALKQNPQILAPDDKQLNRFLSLLENKLKGDKQLKALEIREGYPNEVFKISERIKSLEEKVTQILESNVAKTTGYPKELCAVNRRDANAIIGRKNNLERIRASLLNQHTTALLNGMGGIGKTTLAEAYVAKFYNDYKHIAWLTVENGLKESLLSNYALIKNLKIEVTEPDQQFEACLNALRTLQGEGPFLLVIDNAQEELAAYFNILPKPPKWHVLITSRRRYDLEIKTIDVDFLSSEQAVDLFKKYCQSFTNNQVESIVKQVEYHTLTIEVLAKSASKNRWTFEEIESALSKDKKANVSTSHSSNEKIDRVRSYLVELFKINQLHESEQWILKQFVALPSAWQDYELVHQLLQVDELEWGEEFSSRLENLYELGFLLKNTDDQYKLHQILSEAIQSQFELKVNDVERLLNSVITLLKVDQAKDNPVEKFPFIPYGDKIMELFDSYSIELSALQSNLALVYKVLGDYNSARDLLELALKSDEKNFGAEHPSVAISQSNLSLVYRNLGDYERARDLLELALKSGEKNFGAEHPSVARIRSNLALVYKDLGDYERARDLLELALKSDEKNFGAEHPSVAIRQSNLALVYQNLGNIDKAKIIWKRAYLTFKNKLGEEHSKTQTVLRFLKGLEENGN
ncbi:MAG: tetratricopeptide repeat protein [Cyclobacteriaceae bacterium]